MAKLPATRKKVVKSQLVSPTSYRIYSQPIEPIVQPNGRISRNRKFQLVHFTPCLCVQDSPDNPCPCDHSTVWWIMRGDIVKKGRSTKRDHDGNKLYFFDIDINANVLLQSMKSVSIKTLIK